MRKTIVSATIISTLLTSSVFAADVHTWHKITADNGTWNGRLVITSSDQDAYFTDNGGINKGQTYDFKLTKTTSPFTYGFGFNLQHADFNVSYVLTLYQPADQFSQHGLMFSAKACQFNVSAKGPANPDIRVEEYNGAKCLYSIVPNTGENFEVS
jgi:hypothetical protein